jgi:hypothetical protein
MRLVERLVEHGLALLAVVFITVGASAMLTAAGFALAEGLERLGDPWEAARPALVVGVVGFLFGVPPGIVARRRLRRLLVRPAERRSAARATFFAALLVGSTAIAALAVQLSSSVVSLLWIFVAAPGVPSFDPSVPTLATTLVPPIAVLGVAIVTWQLAARTWQREADETIPDGLAAAVGRLTWYGLLVYVVAGIPASVSQLVSAFALTAGPSSGGVLEPYPSEVDGALLLLVAPIAWLVVLVLIGIPTIGRSRRVISGDPAATRGEARSRFRRGAWALIAFLLAGNLVAGVVAFGDALARLAVNGGSAVPAAGAALAILPYLLAVPLAWSAQAREVARLAPEDGFRADRTWMYAVVVAAVPVAVVGAGLALAIVLRAAVGDPDLGFVGWTALAGAAPPLVVGSIAWAIAWQSITRRIDSSPSERHTIARRATLGAILAGGVTATATIAAYVVGRAGMSLVGAAEWPPIAELADPIALGVSFGIATAITARAWERDGRGRDGRRPPAAQSAAPPVDIALPTEGSPS